MRGGEECGVPLDRGGSELVRVANHKGARLRAVLQQLREPLDARPRLRRRRRRGALRRLLPRGVGARLGLREEPVCGAVDVVPVQLERLLALPRRRVRDLAQLLGQLAPLLLAESPLLAVGAGRRSRVVAGTAPHRGDSRGGCARRLLRRAAVHAPPLGAAPRRRLHRERLDRAAAPVRRLPPVPLVVDREALLVELVAQPVGGLVVVPQPRRLPRSEDLANLLVAEVGDDDGARRAVLRVPLLLL
mmetsp:Transcript_27426/g.91203  ORF Transcript_27426/g.91203 Transcript_27426/m.91203 type:complete len:246 (+) Transcript_27426:2019-2756(+)